MSASVGRLKRRSEFVRVARSGCRYAAPGLVLQVRRRTGKDEQVPTEIRVGFTASRKIGNAVERNRAKRRLRAAADRLLATCAAPRCDYVIIGRRATLTRPFAALLVDLETALQKTDAVRPNTTTAGRTA